MIRALLRRAVSTASRTSSGLIGLHALHHVDLPHAVERGGGEPARVDVAALVHERLQLLVVAEGAGERLVTDLGVAARGRGHQRARAVEHQVGVEALPVDPGRGQHVHQTHGPLEGHGVHEDVGVLSWLRLDVLEDLVLVVDDRVALLDALTHDLCHCRTPSLVGLMCSGVEMARLSRAPAGGGAHCRRWLPGIASMILWRSGQGSAR